MFYVYILISETSGKLYIGHTSDLYQRIEDHNSNRSKYTRFKGPWKLIYKMEFSTRSEAMKFENKLKGYKSKKYILNYIVQELNVG